MKDEDLESNVNNIGKPLATANIYVLDEYLKMLPIGVGGEIYVSGYGVSGGYLDDFHLTESRFLSNPYSRKGSIFYKTGDLGKVLTNGDIEYLGCSDKQLQLRGFRIEIGEIEFAIKKLSECEEVIVIDHDENDGEKGLCAFIVTDNFSDVESELKVKLPHHLPEYMIPTKFLKFLIYR